MTITIFPNGLGGVLGDELVTASQLYTSGLVYFVDSQTGSDSNNGFSRSHPFATLVHAQTVVATNDIVVLLSGHTETLTSKLTLNRAGQKIIGEGSAGGLPTVEITCAVTSDHAISPTAINVTIANILFKKAIATIASSKVLVVGTMCVMRGCYFEFGEFDNQFGVELQADAGHFRIYDTTFAAVAQPSAIPTPLAILFGSNTDVEFEGVTLDGGDDAIGMYVFGEVERFRGERVSLLNGSIVNFSSVTGYCAVVEATGASAVTGFTRKIAGGFGQTGDTILASKDFYMSGKPVYVHYGTGSNANSGLDEHAPKKQIGSALSAANEECDIVVALPYHVEPIAATITPTVIGTTIVGCGLSGGLPTCKIYMSQDASFNLLDMGSTVCYVRNFWFDQSLVANTDSFVLMGTEGNEMRGCYVSPGTLDFGIGSTVKVNSNFCTVRDTKFISLSAAVAARTQIGLEVVSDDVVLRGVEVSDGEHGFSQEALLIDGGEGTAERVYVIALTQSKGADAVVGGDTTGTINPETSDSSAMMSW